MALRQILTRDFTLGFFAQLTFSFVFCLLLPTIPIYLSRFEAKEAEIGILVGVFSVSSLTLRPFIGKALLKISEKRFMVAGAAIYTLSSLAYLLAPPFWPFLGIRIIHGIGLALFSTASFTLVANIAPETHRGQFISYYYLSINFSFAVAPTIGMFVINQFDFAILFSLCAFLSLFSLFITTKLKEGPAVSTGASPSQSSSFFSREAFPPAFIAFMVNIIWGAVVTFLPLYALIHGVKNPGIVFGASAITIILCRSLGGRILDVYSRERLIFPCLILLMIAMLILAFSKTLLMFILVAVLWGGAMAFLYPTLVALAIDRGGPSRGPAMGTFSAIADLGSGLGPVIMGVVLQLTDYTIMFLCLSLTGILNLFYFYFFVTKGRKRYADL